MHKALTIAMAAAVIFGVLDDASARPRKHRTSNDAEAAFWSDLVPTKRGVPIIMKGFEPPALPGAGETRQRADRPVYIPRGSSTYIPPPSPSPYSTNSPPAAALTQPAPAPYQPPKITTFSDRVNDAIHAYPLQQGIGNNPSDPQMFLRQRLNQP